MHIKSKVSILGCGHGGMALAADLKIKGAQVAIWSDPKHIQKFNKILDKNGEVVLHDGNKTTTARLDLVSHDFSEVMRFGDVIYNCTPMNAHTPLFKKLTGCMSLIKSRKLFINLSGVFSGLDQLLNVGHREIFNRFRVFDTSTFPYACRAGESNDVTILGRKSELTIAPLFPADSQYINPLPDSVKPARFNIMENSIKLGLTGTNAVFHPATVLFNARLIDNGSSFLFYREGISKRTSLLHEALDSERLRLAETMGYSLNPCVEDDNKYYGTNFINSYDFSVNSTVHKKITAPTTLNHRFVNEDIAYGLVPLLALGRLHKMSLPNIESVINIFSTIMGVNYYQSGRNLSGITREFIRHLTWHATILDRITA
ncbi:Opine dehydrogenase [Aquicella siphonis]|uniref:Opine dehydrogenase n=1 Tax=Aquicella siphonis TaxID=254247 RepID=A0A5E4PJE8_9COXI|nr:NAD/NADP-dependent octopine/nopaline dehydrogenase family protein [Aquicella siphonis]VVC77150.1 Opine dehydrogenase [Aquicella siphonis]